ncbi:MAG: hypothetical protein HKO64_05240 [Xanthomonadales bacterium]|nr:hypothetical protein [Xanthomonadales bacterium]NNL95005.1 hypothetical protein [Xanthomonadales bacterium]
MSLRAAQLTLALISFLVAAPVAVAGTVDLRDLPGNFDQSSWNGGGTRFYAQSLLADDNYLTSVAFRPVPQGGGQEFQFYITGARVAGGGLGFEPDFNDIRFISDKGTLPPVADGFVELACDPNATVTPDETVFLVFDGLTETGPSAKVRATEFGGTEKYPPGEFVFLNTTYGPPPDNSSSWSHRAGDNEDLAVLAVFADQPVANGLDCGNVIFRQPEVPVPTMSQAALTTMLVLLALLGGLAIRRRTA